MLHSLELVRILVQVLKLTEGFMNGNKATTTYYIYLFIMLKFDSIEKNFKY